MEFQEYDARPSEVARLVSDIIQVAIPKVVVEYVGSTAIPGCSGRGVIDLMILYDVIPLEPILVGLDTLGFQWAQRNPTLADDWPKGMGGHLFSRRTFPITHPCSKQQRPNSVGETHVS